MIPLEIHIIVYSSLSTQLMQARLTNLEDFSQNGIGTYVIQQQMRSCMVIKS